MAQRNLFVADGVWDEQSYVPAYVRRYPFVFMQAGEQDEYVLALDSAAKQVNQGLIRFHCFRCKARESAAEI